MNLKEIRVSRKLKVQEVSDYLCCLPSVYSRYENGKREPSIDILLKLSKLYGVSVDCLIGNDEVVDTSITEKEAAMISAYSSGVLTSTNVTWLLSACCISRQ